MPEWPDKYAFAHAIEWNEVERRRALADVTNKALKVPTNVIKIVGGDRVVLSPDEYRAQRQGDADRFARNVVALKDRL